MDSLGSELIIIIHAIGIFKQLNSTSLFIILHRKKTAEEEDKDAASQCSCAWLRKGGGGYDTYRARICKRLRSPRIDSEESIPSA
jgi:hypothetical protein